MNNNTPSYAKSIAVIIGFTIIAVLVIWGGISAIQYIRGELKANQDESAKGLNQDQDRDTFNVIGTGYLLSGGPASTTAINTIYQFASSTDETYWNTSSFAAPHTSGATTTNYFLARNAEIITFNGVFKGNDALSSVVLEVGGSNNSSCNAGLTTSNTANWYPLTARSSSSSPEVMEELWTRTINPADTASTTFAFVFDDINYDCLRVRAYNSSTTDESLLYMEATIKE